jgi:hypothetical protein
MIILMRPRESNISFHEEGDELHNLRQKTQHSRLTRWIIKYSGGIIKTERQAQAIMALIAMLLIGHLAIDLIQSDETKNNVLHAPPGKTIVYPDNAPPHVE